MYKIVINNNKTITLSKEQFKLIKLMKLSNSLCK